MRCRTWPLGVHYCAPKNCTSAHLSACKGICSICVDDMRIVTGFARYNWFCTLQLVFLTCTLSRVPGGVHMFLHLTAFCGTRRRQGFVMKWFRLLFAEDRNKRLWQVIWLDFKPAWCLAAGNGGGCACLQTISARHICVTFTSFRYICASLRDVFICALHLCVGCGAIR